MRDNRRNHTQKQYHRATFKTVKKQIQIRNLRDVSRKNSPLLKSHDAVIVDTGKLKKIPDMINKMSEIMESKIRSKYGS